MKVHHVFANRSNIGDWLSARGIQSLLAPQMVAEYLCDAPFIKSTLSRLSTVATPEDLIVIGGGGLFMDYFSPFWEGFKPIGWRVPFCIWGVGYCDLKRESSRPPAALLQEIVRVSRLCVVRDEITRAHLPGCSLPPPVPCPSLAVLDTVPITEPGLLHVTNYTTAGAKVYERMRKMSMRFAKLTGRIYRETDNRIVPSSESDLARLLRLYARSDIILSSGLHGCVIGLAMGRPVLAVSGDRKIEGFMDAMGLSKWVCDQGQVEEIPKRLEGLPNQAIPHAAIEQVRQQHRAIAAQVLSGI